MALVRTGETSSFSGPVFRDGYTLMSPRVTASLGGDPQSPLGVVNIGTPNSPIYWPEDPFNPGEAFDDPYLINLGTGDGLELVAGGSDADNELGALVVYTMEPVVDPDGVTIAFFERQLITLTMSLGATVLPVGDPLAAAFSEIEEGDFIADSWSVMGGTPGIFAIAAGGTWGHVVIEARQSHFIRISLLPVTVTAMWVLGRKIQGDALSVQR